MSKFVNSREGILSPLQIWKEVPTQISVQETYVLKVYPVTNIFNDGPIHLVIPPQPNGMLKDIEIITKFRIDEDGKRITDLKDDLSIINNFANALWELVDIQVDDRIYLTQSMKKAYAYATFFNTVLNSETNREDYLFENEIFKMDKALYKAAAEDTNAFTLDTSLAAAAVLEEIKDLPADKIKWNTTVTAAISNSDEKANVPLFNYYQYVFNVWRNLKNDQKNDYYYSPNPKNPASAERAMRLNRGQSVIISSKLHCPLLSTEKCLPTRIRMRVSLTKNSDDFLLLVPLDSKYEVMIEDIYMNVTYFRPIDVILNRMEEHLAKEAAPYFVSKPEIIIRPITNSNRIIRVNNVFHNKLPTYAFFCLQNTPDFEGRRNANPYAFIPFGKFQIYVNGVPHFVDPLEISYHESIIDHVSRKLYTENGFFLRQLYRTIGREYKGNSFITSKNFQLNFIVGVSFTADRSNTSARYLNLQQQGSTNVEIDMGYDNDIPQDMVLIIYALYDRQIQINGERQFNIIE